MAKLWRVVDLGTQSYRDVWARQLALVAEMQRGEAEGTQGTRMEGTRMEGTRMEGTRTIDTLLLVEHPHVFTLGRSKAAEANLLAPGEVEVVAIERGGDVTYHGPGQIVAYPIIALGEGERDLHKFLRNLEEAVIRTCARMGLVADREPGKTGVWTGPREARRKLCSMGIACRKWITFHGLALNVTTDLDYFRRINPCGFEAGVMSSLAAQLGRPEIDVPAVRTALADELGAALGRATA